MEENFKSLRLWRSKLGSLMVKEVLFGIGKKSDGIFEINFLNIFSRDCRKNKQYFSPLQEIFLGRAFLKGFANEGVNQGS